MSFGACELTILGDFTPFGLIAEALDGKPSDTCMDDYRYFLFSPEVTKQRDEADELDLPLPSDQSDHELFIRGNRIIWSIGSRVYKRFTSPSTVIKSLYVHIPSRHPSSFPELELPTLLQSAALLSVGLLYEGSAHPQTMQILLGEIGRRSGGDNVLEREGYAVAAGFSLGLVALGRGEDAPGFVDALVDRLFLYIGGKEPQNER